MKRFIISIASVAALLAGASTALAAERVAHLSVPGMTCSLCPVTVAKALENVPGVMDVAVDLDAKTARVRFDDETTSVDALTKATTDAGYPSTLGVEHK